MTTDDAHREPNSSADTCGREVEPESAAEWAARLTADDCELLIQRCMEAHDFHGVKAALGLLTTKDPHRAEEVLGVIQAGLAVARRRAEGSAS